MRNNAHMDTRAEAAQAVKAAETEAKALGIDIAELHGAAGVHRATWNRWRAGEFAPSLDQWLSVQALLRSRRPVDATKGAAA